MSFKAFLRNANQFIINSHKICLINKSMMQKNIIKVIWSKKIITKVIYNKKKQIKISHII